MNNLVDTSELAKFLREAKKNIYANNGAPMKQIELIAKRHYTNLPYHNFKHVLLVRDNALKFAKRCEKYKIPVDRETVEIAALFHDAGYEKAKTGKEEYSCKIAGEELKKLKYPPRFIGKVKGTIMATKKDWPLKTSEQKILRAADLRSFTGAYGKFLEASRKIIREYKILHGGADFPAKKWAGLVESYLKPRIKLTPEWRKDNFRGKAERNIEEFLRELSSRSRKSAKSVILKQGLILVKQGKKYVH